MPIVCTHVGCICNAVANGMIDCPCHGSKFKITDGVWCPMTEAGWDGAAEATGRSAEIVF